MNSLDRRYEETLGQIAGGWHTYPDGSPLPAGVQLVHFPDAPFSECVTVATLGLHRLTLRLPSSRPVQQELLLAARVPAAQAGALAQVVSSVLKKMAANSWALRSGDVIPLAEGILEGVSGLVVADPAYFPQHLTEGPQLAEGEIVFVWLVPLVGDEKAFVETYGWDHFEEHLDRADPDLLDLRRHPIVTL